MIPVKFRLFSVQSGSHRWSYGYIVAAIEPNVNVKEETLKELESKYNRKFSSGVKYYITQMGGTAASIRMTKLYIIMYEDPYFITFKETEIGDLLFLL